MPALSVPVVVASSDKAYGDNRGVAYTEDLPLLARHPYDVSKACTDLLSQTYAYTYDMPIAVARCGNTMPDAWGRDLAHHVPHLLHVPSLTAVNGQA